MEEEKKIRVLVVDDDQTLLDMYSERLGASNFEVITAADGEEALKITREKMPDCILLDILLPKMNGFDVLHSIRATEETKNIPVIMLTALVQESNKEKGMAEGADDFILKSETTSTDVISKIKEVIAKKRGQAAS